MHRLYDYVPRRWSDNQSIWNAKTLLCRRADRLYLFRADRIFASILDGPDFLLCFRSDYYLRFDSFIPNLD